MKNKFKKWLSTCINTLVVIQIIIYGILILCVSVTTYNYVYVAPYYGRGDEYINVNLCTRWVIIASIMMVGLFLILKKVKEGFYVYYIAFIIKQVLLITMNAFNFVKIDPIGGILFLSLPMIFPILIAVLLYIKRKVSNN